MNTGQTLVILLMMLLPAASYGQIDTGGDLYEDRCDCAPAFGFQSDWYYDAAAPVVPTGNMRAHHRASSGYIMDIRLQAVWAEVLFLPGPHTAAGAGAGIAILRNMPNRYDQWRQSLAMRLWYGIGTDWTHFKLRQGTEYYTDADVLLEASAAYRGFSSAFMAGYSYRRWPDMQPEYSGSRLKLGAELNYMLIRDRIALRFRLMGSFFGPEDDIEYGPISLGFVFGWFDSE